MVPPFYTPFTDCDFQVVPTLCNYVSTDHLAAEVYEDGIV